ncbi:MAG: TatD family hydrolase [Verrucomicrobia bacterium]|jgi:TatD DNase family protein|nr:TatD family hydrolase [Verrucomicrobiota bacterium]
MNFFDTHAHFSRLGGEYSLESQISRAEEMGVTRIVAVGGSCELNKAAVDAATAYPGMIRVALGFDRDEAEALGKPSDLCDALDRLRLAVSQLPKRGVQVAAIGEIGLDYFYSAETAEQQVALFRAQLELANELRLPVVIHSRDADVDTLEALKDHAQTWSGDPERIGVLHCFTRDAAFAADLVDLGYHISFSGIVTFLNADPLREVARTIPADRLLIETDSPYLAPAPMRGKRNEPGFVSHVATRLAAVRDTDVAELTEQTFENASRLFGW